MCECINMPFNNPFSSRERQKKAFIADIKISKDDTIETYIFLIKNEIRNPIHEWFNDQYMLFHLDNSINSKKTQQA